MTEQTTSLPHPGTVLADKLTAIEMNGSQLADRIQVPKNRIYQILDGRRAITADTALRLGHFFGTGAEWWLNLQKRYELDLARQSNEVDLAQIQPYRMTEARRQALCV